MTLRPWGEVPYLAILGMRPAEMRALEELPGQTKDALLPMVPLRPWVGAHYLESAQERIVQSYGERPIVVSVGEREVPKKRPVFAELEALRDPSRGFRNWCDFIEDNGSYIPTAQIGVNPNEELIQFAQLHALGRGLVVHLERPTFPNLHIISGMIGGMTNGGLGVCFILDFGTASADHLHVAALTVGYIEALLNHSPNAHVSISASSFPSSFSNITGQPIYERRLFNEVAMQVALGRLIYSDRGSARAEQLSGGSGVIPARIDYPLFDDWLFFRSDEAGFDGYVEQAQVLQTSEFWNADLRVWGTQMIERTARGDHSAIDTPLKATAARINLHLQMQAFYGDMDDAQDTEEDWDG